MKTTLLSVRDLRCAQAGPVSFDLRGGECLGLVGPSGSGKSVVLRMLADLIPHEGTMTLDGIASGDVSGPAWRRRVRYVASEPGWWANSIGEHLGTTVAQDHRLAALRLDPAIRSRRIDAASTGERQRIALLRGIEDDPAVLLLDEPTSALDPETTACVEALLCELLAKGTAIVLVSHDAGQVSRLAVRTISARPAA